MTYNFNKALNVDFSGGCSLSRDFDYYRPDASKRFTTGPHRTRRSRSARNFSEPAFGVRWVYTKPGSHCSSVGRALPPAAFRRSDRNVHPSLRSFDGPSRNAAGRSACPTTQNAPLARRAICFGKASSFALAMKRPCPALPLLILFGLLPTLRPPCVRGSSDDAPLPANVGASLRQLITWHRALPRTLSDAERRAPLSNTVSRKPPPSRPMTPRAR